MILALEDLAQRLKRIKPKKEKQAKEERKNSKKVRDPTQKRTHHLILEN